MAGGIEVHANDEIQDINDLDELLERSNNTNKQQNRAPRVQPLTLEQYLIVFY
jgi:hypothetical protein